MTVVAPCAQLPDSLGPTAAGFGVQFVQSTPPASSADAIALADV